MKTELMGLASQVCGVGATAMYQGVILTFLVGLALRFSRTNAATRHAIWFGTLLAVAALFPFHLWLDKPMAREMTNSSAAPVAVSGGVSSAIITPAAPPIENGAPADMRTFVGGSGVAADFQSPDSQGDLPETDDVTEKPAGLKTVQAPSIVTAQPPASAPALLKLPIFHPAAWQFRSALAQRAALASVVLVICLATVRLLRLGLQLYQLRHLKRSAPVADEELCGRMQDLRVEASAKRDVALRLSPVPRSAMLIGYLHPAILLPEEESSAARRPEAEHILRHELAHLARRDDWANLAQQVLVSLLCFHPAAWWISQRLTLEREIACDDHVLAKGGRPKNYALLLADLAGRLSTSQLSLAPGVSTNKSQLQQRINMILNTRRNRSPRLARMRLGIIASGTLLVAALGGYCAPRFVLMPAVASENPTADPTVPSSSSASELAPVPAAAPSAGVPAADIFASQSDDDKPGPMPSGIPEGEKEKPDASDSAPALAPVPAVPATPPAPAEPFVSAPQARARAHATPLPARPPRALVEPSLGEGSVEERLAHLEAMVRSLMREEHLPRKRAEAAARDYAPLPPKAEAEVFPRDLEIVQQAAEAGRLAAEQGRRAAEQGLRAAEDALRSAEKATADKEAGKAHFKIMSKDAYKRQMEAYSRAREAMQREMEKMNREMEQLQRELDRSFGEKPEQPGAGKPAADPFEKDSGAAANKAPAAPAAKF